MINRIFLYLIIIVFFDKMIKDHSVMYSGNSPECPIFECYCVALFDWRGFCFYISAGALADAISCELGVIA